MLDDFLSDPKYWPLVADMVRAEMIPDSRLAEIARDHPEFWETVRAS